MSRRVRPISGRPTIRARVPHLRTVFLDPEPRGGAVLVLSQKHRCRRGGSQPAAVRRSGRDFSAIAEPCTRGPPRAGGGVLRHKLGIAGRNCRHLHRVGARCPVGHEAAFRRSHWRTTVPSAVVTILRRCATSLPCAKDLTRPARTPLRTCMRTSVPVPQPTRRLAIGVFKSDTAQDWRGMSEMRSDPGPESRSCRLQRGVRTHTILDRCGEHRLQSRSPAGQLGRVGDRLPRERELSKGF